MGVVIIFIILTYLVFWLLSVARSSYASPRRNRVAFPIGSRAVTLGEPIIKPVDEIEKIPARLPQIELDFVPISVSTPLIDTKTEVSPNFIPHPSKIEESLLFRSLVFAMFGVSVIGVDFAAGTHFSWTGIPFATIGAVWSWYRRHHAKHWLNILVFIVSLAIVFSTFVPILFKQIPAAIDLLAPSNKLAATLELTLGSIAVALQMGLSFALYSRRILGYCLLISGILIGVAAGLSQNISFLILLCGWIAIVMPTLMLDYRSRLALQPLGFVADQEKSQLSHQKLPWQYLAQLAAVSIGLGLIISIFLPNFHLPNLSFKQPGIDKLQTIAQKYKPADLPTAASPSPSPINSQTSADSQVLASKVFGQPGNNNYPDSIKQENLQLPPELRSQLQQLTQQILATSPQPLNSDFDRSTYLAEYLKQHHQSAPPPPNSADLPPLDSKLIQQSISQCTTDPQTCKMVGNKQDLPVIYTSMLRSIDIPARLKTGEQVAKIDPQTKLYPRPPAQLPSQTEMYAPNWGWVPLDATPDRAVLNLTAEQQTQLQAQLQQQTAPNPKASTTPTPPANPTNPADLQPPSDHPSSPPTSPTDPPKLDLDPKILQTVAIIILIIGCIAIYLHRYRQQQHQLASLPPIERIYRSMLISLSKTGNTKLPAQTQLEYAQSIKNTEHPQIAQVTTEISQLYTAWRYGKQKIDINKLARKLQNLQHLQQLAANRQRQQWLKNQKKAIFNLTAKIQRSNRLFK
jgi:TgpA N-terminal domain